MSTFAPLRQVLAEAEEKHIRAVLAQVDRFKEAAAVLGMSQRYLIERRRKYKLPIKVTNLSKK